MDADSSEGLIISAGCEVVLAPGRYRPQPSERNLRIYEAVRMQGRTQVEIARETGLSQRRVSQICQQVESWRSSTPAARQKQPSAADRFRIERQLLRRQLERLYGLAMQAADRGRQPIVVQRAGVRNGKPWWETVRQEQGPSVQWLKLAMRAAELLVALEARPAESSDAAWLAKLAEQASGLMEKERRLTHGVRPATGTDANSSRSSNARGEFEGELDWDLDCAGDVSGEPAGSCDEPTAGSAEVIQANGRTEKNSVAKS